MSGRLVRLPNMQILVLIGTVGVSPHTGEILPPCDFLTVLSCPVLYFLGNAPRSNLQCRRSLRPEIRKERIILRLNCGALSVPWQPSPPLLACAFVRSSELSGNDQKVYILNVISFILFLHLNTVYAAKFPSTEHRNSAEC